MKPTLPWYLKPAGFSFRPILLVLFTLPFFAIALVLLWSMSGRSVRDWWLARSWEPVSAVIQKAWLETHQGDEDEGYKVAATYTYTYHGRSFEGTQPSFVHNWTNVGVNGMREKVRQLEPGKEVECWVNPANPAEAVLDRSLPAEVVVGFFFSIPFFTVGCVGLCILALPSLRVSLRRKRLAQLRPLIHAGQLPAWVPDLFFSRHAPPDEERTALVIAQDERMTAALALTCFNLFWNSIVVVFVCAAVIFFVSGERLQAVLLFLFLTPFITIGAVMLWKWSKHWRLARRPGWVAVVRPMPDFAGGEAGISWAWLNPPSAFRSSQAAVRLVALATQWDQESDQPSQSLGKRRRARVTDAAATQRGELELAAVEIPLQDGARPPFTVRLPPVVSPNGQLTAQGTRKSEKLAQLTWGGWWQLEVVYPDGEVETAKLTQAVKFD